MMEYEIIVLLAPKIVNRIASVTAVYIQPKWQIVRRKIS